MFFSLTELVSGSVAGEISSDSSNVVELIQVSGSIHSYVSLGNVLSCAVCPVLAFIMRV